LTTNDLDFDAASFVCSSIIFGVFKYELLVSDLFTFLVVDEQLFCAEDDDDDEDNDEHDEEDEDEDDEEEDDDDDEDKDDDREVSIFELDSSGVSGCVLTE
jgi:hypothetical protein